MEIEIKYAPVSYETFAKIAADLSLMGEETVTMSANYFDTADGFLSHNKISLRSRTENGVSVYTMKCSLKSSDGVAVREEEELATEDINAAFDRFAQNGRLWEIVEKCRKNELISIAKMEFIRRKFTHNIGSTTVEISHDTGTMEGKKGGTATILEMEVELKSGSEKEMKAFLKTLEKYGLTVENRSKLSRARAL